MAKAEQRVWMVVAGLVLLALVIRLGLAAAHGIGAAPRPGSDQFEYDSYAWNLAQGNGYRGPSADVADPNHLTAFRPPGPSLVWAGVYRVVGHRYGAVRALNCLLSALTVALVFCIGARCYGRAVGVLAAAGYAVWPSAVLYSTDLLSESLGTFCFLTFILLALKFAADSRRWWWAVGAGLLLGYAVLTRANFIFMIAIVGVWAVWQFRWSWPAMGRAMLIPVAAGLVMVPWTVRNYMVFHAFIPLSTMGGSGLLQGNNRLVATEPALYGYSVWDTRIPEYADALRSAGNEVERDRRAKAFAVKWLMDNRDKWGTLVEHKIVRGWTPILQPNSPLVYRVLSLVTWGPVLVLFLPAFAATLVLAVWRRRASVLLHLAIVSSLVITVVFWGETRYRHGIEPLCLIWAAVTLVWLGRRVGLIDPEELEAAVGGGVAAELPVAAESRPAA